MSPTPPTVTLPTRRATYLTPRALRPSRASLILRAAVGGPDGSILNHATVYQAAFYQHSIRGSPIEPSI